MIEHLYEDLSVHLYEGEPITKKAPTPPPIIYLTQWKIVGNSEVHTDPHLTSWKVSGNSVVDNNTILSCGDLGQDGKYHVKISNGVIIYDIPLDAPLRKVNDVADTIEFPSSVDGKALVTRNILYYLLENLRWAKHGTENRYVSDITRLYCVMPNNSLEVPLILCNKYTTVSFSDRLQGDKQITVLNSNGNYLSVMDSDVTSASNIQGEILLQLVTPTTKLIDASPFPISATDTYTSANDTPFSAFEHTENKEIWSCGEYNATDGKYHILVQPLGGSIANIVLTEPLRKVNDVADTIEFPSDTPGKALVTRNIKSVIIGNTTPSVFDTMQSDKYRFKIASDAKPLLNYDTIGNIICAKYRTITGADAFYNITGIAGYTGNSIMIYDDAHCTTIEDFLAANTDTEVIYESATPTTELVDAPQIEKAESYSMVISQGAKAVEWSSFETND